MPKLQIHTCTVSKYCSSCEVELPKYRFSNDRNRKDGLGHYCKTCSKAKYQKYRYDCQGSTATRNIKQDHVWQEYHCRYERLHKTAKHDIAYRKELQEFFKNRPEGMTVDHIVPLQGKEVCGLHVPWNLQYLSQSDNARKGNKLIIEEQICP